MHLKRQKVPKTWPIHRKGTIFVVRPNSNLKKGVPILIVLRDMLKVAQNRKEVKRAIHLKQILINSRNARDEKNSVTLFDVITLISGKDKAKKSYRMGLSEKGKFNVEEIKETEANKKVAKIINKKTLKKKKTQLNLSDGGNFLSNIKCNVNDSVLISLKDKQIEKCLELKEKSKVIVSGGKHSGQVGTITKMMPERKMAKITTKEKRITVLIKQLMVIE